LKELACLAAGVAEFCREHGLDREMELDLNLALEELFTNALRHGGCLGMEEAVSVRLRALPDAVGVEFRDHGGAFNPLLAAPPDLAVGLKERPAGGLGLHLLRSVMRDLSYRREGNWNLVAMRRPIARGGAS
jgi:serine/threonine-protein kinase RsbW